MGTLSSITRGDKLLYGAEVTLSRDPPWGMDRCPYLGVVPDWVCCETGLIRRMWHEC